MFTFLVMLKISSDNLPEVKRLFDITKWIVLLFCLLNIGVLALSLSSLKYAYCTKKQPNSIGALLAKGLLVLFDVMIFVLHCFKWGIKNKPDGEWEDGRKESLKYYQIMTKEYLKWTIILFVFRILLETTL